ncbi:MAG: GGDEF domain-containing protein [Myxococcales bacterium]|jgi:diguanylate cyclase (GGDEF)-like protein
MSDEFDEKTVVATSVSPAPALGSKRAQLVVLSGNNVGEMYNVASDLVLGRGRDADVRIQGDGISRQHVRLRIEDGSVVLQDLGSTNGSFVNGDRVSTPRRLEDGDKIQLGSATILKFTYQDALDEDFQRQMFESASRDALTQVYNKRYFVERLHSEFAFARRHGVPLSLIIFDIDHFKQVNDTHGHLAGDYVLAELAKVVSPAIRSEDTFARYGGEEFVIMSRSTDPPSAAVVSERVRAAVEAHDFVYEGVPIPVTISAGLAATPHPEVQSPEDLVARADRALYEAKRGGRNQVVIAER